MKNYQNILIVRTDRIGDVVLTTPALKRLRLLFPGSKITVLLSPLTKDLLKGHPSVDEIIIDDRKNEHKGLLGFFKLVRFLRKKKYDLTIIFHTKKRTNALCFLAGIPCRMGYKNNKYGFLLTHPIVDKRQEGLMHESQYCLNVLKYIPAKGNSPSLEDSSKENDLYVPSDELSDIWAEDFFVQNGIDKTEKVIVIHAGASDVNKRCSSKFFSEVIESLIARYNVKILLVGADYVKSVSREILSLIASGNNSKVIDLAGKTTINQLVSLLKNASLLISNDSGPVHLAAALNLPVISLFVRNRPGINPERWAPLGERSRCLSVPKENDALNAQNFDKTGNGTNTKNQDWQDFITKDRILEEVDALFKL